MRYSEAYTPEGGSEGRTCSFPAQDTSYDEHMMRTAFAGTSSPLPSACLIGSNASWCYLLLTDGADSEGEDLIAL